MKAQNPFRDPSPYVGRTLLCLLGLMACRAEAQEGIYDWTQGRQLWPGVRYVKVRTEDPRTMVVHGLRIDSQTPGLKFHTTPGRLDWVEGQTETDRQTTRDFLRQARANGTPMVVAINADAFSPWPAPYDVATPTNVQGLAVSDGKLVSPGANTPSLLQLKSGELRIEVTRRDTDIAATQLAVSGFNLCLVEGRVLPSDHSVHPRTGLGLSSEGRYVVAVAIDGRQPRSAGATIGDVGHWLKHFGAHNGINMDGGGSTTMAWWDPAGTGESKTRLLNSPVGNGDNLASLPAASFTPSERANGNNFGVSLAAPSDAEQAPSQANGRLDVAGVVVTPHVRAPGLHFATIPGSSDGARIQFFVRNPGPDPIVINELSFDKLYPQQQILAGNWSWHDTPNAWGGRRQKLPPGALSVWTINAVRPTWTDDSMRLTIADWAKGEWDIPVSLEQPPSHISAVTFLGEPARPTRMVVHVRNTSDRPLRLESVRLWQPRASEDFHLLSPQPWLEDVTRRPVDGVVPPGDHGIVVVRTSPLPLTYAAVELRVAFPEAPEAPEAPATSLWAHTRIHPMAFDISGGWVDGQAADGKSLLRHEPFLKTLKLLYVNTAHIGIVPGYNEKRGQDSLYARYPLKNFGHLHPTAAYDRDDALSYVHGVENLGEPQVPFGGGARLPQEVFQALQVYRSTRLATTVTLSDEGSFAHYAGLADFPHYDAYRVSAPSADDWTRYDRWGGKRIAWGAPLETIGVLCRTLREISRPRPTAVWSQGPHEGWGVYDGRERTSPTVDELRLQAYHALSSRVTSLYWFNLSLGSLLRFPDTLEEMTRIGREIRLLESFYLEGDAFRYEQVRDTSGALDWDLASIVAPHGALLFALDLRYTPDAEKRVFRFGAPRPSRFDFELPSYLLEPTDVFRIDADGIHSVEVEHTPGGIALRDEVARVAVYVATHDRGLRGRLETHRQQLEAAEAAWGFHPARRSEDLEALRALEPR